MHFTLESAMVYLNHTFVGSMITRLQTRK